MMFIICCKLLLFIINIFKISLEDNINKTTYEISLKNKVKDFNFIDENLNDEYNFYSFYIDEDNTHKNQLAPGVKELDRYSDIKPYKYNIIEINKKNKEKPNKYINASPINIINPTYFIATQAPKPKTVDDFWTMIDEQDSNVILMLCNLEEAGKKKCEDYWGERNKENKIETENYIIESKIKENDDQYIIREINFLNKSTNVKKTINQIHYVKWPDHGVPETKDGKVFEAFHEIIKKVNEFRNNKPIIIHCSAGVGRTGTFISMYYLEKEIINQKNEQIIKFNIFNLVRKIKEMRLNMVQTVDQYKFIYEYVKYLLSKYI